MALASFALLFARPGTGHPFRPPLPAAPAHRAGWLVGARLVEALDPIEPLGDRVTVGEKLGQDRLDLDEPRQIIVGHLWHAMPDQVGDVGFAIVWLVVIASSSSSFRFVLLSSSPFGRTGAVGG